MQVLDGIEKRMRVARSRRDRFRAASTRFVAILQLDWPRPNPSSLGDTAAGGPGSVALYLS